MLTPEEYIGTHQDRFLDELMDFLRIPSVSTSRKYAEDVRKAAEFIKQKLLEAGADQARLIETKGHPLVYGKKMVNQSLPTVLVYGHYDVQPADPDELWETPPFEPVVRAGKIYARGASDDKSQVYMHIKALETMLATEQLPCNIHFLIEGEEENGSEGLTHFLEYQENRSMLQSDAVLVSDTTLLSLEQPSLTVGLRGIVYLEVEVTGPNRDLHSGIYGGAVGNPINILCQMLASLHDAHYRVAIPGFYDDVEPLSEQDREELAKVYFELSEYQDALGIESVVGEQGYSTLERIGIRPALDINGIWGGYTGEGGKTVLPSQANAKLSMRLVPHQDAQKIVVQFTNYFTSLAPRGIKVKVQVLHSVSNAVVVATNAVALQAAKKAFEEVWNKSPVLTRDGGSIPIIARFKETLGCDIVMMGFGLDSDAIHSPNEHFRVENFFKGIGVIISFYKHLAVLHA
jgi:acetylornithine deacetylase/succinyl-diaminopimelate desuccinylase-like protein